MTGKELLKEIRRHLRITKESPYAFGRRVMGDQTFLWKLRHHDRQPRRKTLQKIARAIRRAEDRHFREAMSRVGIGTRR